MRDKLIELVSIAMLTLALAGCTAGVNGDATGENQLSVTGQVAVAQPVPTNPPGPIDGAEMLAKPGSLPFVRSNPESVPPFPLVLNRSVQTYVNGYLSQPQGLRRSFKRSSPYMAEMVSLLRDRGLPTDLIYLSFAESGFAPTGAGPWQLSRQTARRYGLTINKWLDERRDPIKSTRAAADYLVELHQQTGPDWRMTLVAWNNGENGVDRYMNLSDEPYDRLMKRLPRRTRSLMNRFMAVALIARHHEYGLEQTAHQDQPQYRIVAVKGGTPLEQIAERRHTNIYRLQLLNPALLSNRTPPSANAYLLRVPADVLEARLEPTDS